jgi:hypothetical protein
VSEAYVCDRAGALFEPWWPPLRDAYLALMAQAGVTPDLTGDEFLTAHASYKQVADADTLALLDTLKSYYKTAVGKLRYGPHDGDVEKWAARVSSDPWHRPDVRAYVLSAARLAAHRRFAKTYRLTGHAPFAVSHDRAVYTSPEPSPLPLLPVDTARRPVPGTVRLGVRPGSVKLEGVAPLADLLRRSKQADHNPADVVSRYDAAGVYREEITENA